MRKSGGFHHEPAREADGSAQAYLAAHPQTKKGGNHQTPIRKKLSAKSALSFVEDTAGKTGRSKRSVEMDVARAEALGDDLDRVSGTSFDKGVELDLCI